MTNIYKRLEKKRRREKYKRQITEEIVDYNNAMIDTNITILSNMITSMYDVTGWQPTTLKDYINCAKYENNMKNSVNNTLWYIPNELDMKDYLNIKLNIL